VFDPVYSLHTLVAEEAGDRVITECSSYVKIHEVVSKASVATAKFRISILVCKENASVDPI
jgi:hypothetical protein